MHIFLVTVLAGDAVEAHLAEGALVGPGVGVRVLVLGERELGRESPRAVAALERLVPVRCVDADGVVGQLGLGREGLGADLAHEGLLIHVDDPDVLLEGALVAVHLGALPARKLDLFGVEADVFVQT